MKKIVAQLDSPQHPPEPSVTILDNNLIDAEIETDDAVVEWSRACQRLLRAVDGECQARRRVEAAQ